ncbi:MAG: ATP-binding cassette domain-containing protein [Magnetospirillum sp.]|nr:ATP-binding cassette domain-containing protein [Magnetospirillum sp.]
MSDIKPATAGEGDSKTFSLGELSTLKNNLFDLGISSLFLNVLGLALPMSLLQVYDRILPNQSTGTMIFLLGGVLCALCLESLLNLGRSYITGWVGAKFEHNAGCRGLETVVMTSIHQFEKEGSGTHLERLGSLATVREFYAGQAMMTFMDLPFAILYLGLVAMMGGVLVFVPLALLIAFGLSAMNVGKTLRQAINKRMIADDRRFSFIIEVLGGIHSVKAMAMESQMVRRYERLQEGCAQGYYDVALRSASAMGVSSFFSQVTMVCVAAFGSVIVINGDMTTGGLAACSMLAGRALSPLQKALGTWTRFQSFILARQRIDALFAMPPEAKANLPKVGKIGGRITLDKASFRFADNHPWIVEDAEIDIAEGECVVISGGNGSGKTTLLTMMQGAVQPTRGRVLLDGEDIASFEPQSVRDRVAYLPQSGVLFQGTILQNITMFRPALDDVAVETAALLGLDEVVATMAQGFDSAVGDGAYDSLPRGIKQRIAIARALVNNPRVVLFDEANAAMDSQGDNYIRVWLERAKGKRTLVLVTPRPSLAKLGDRVFDLKGGRLVARQTQGGRA